MDFQKLVGGVSDALTVNRDIVGEHVLGLPREPNVEKGLTWSETRRGASP